MELQQLAPPSFENTPQYAYTPSPASTSSCIPASATPMPTSPENWNTATNDWNNQSENIFDTNVRAKMSSCSPQTRTSIEYAVFEIIMKADREYYKSWRHQDNYGYDSHQNNYETSRARHICVDLTGYSNHPLMSAGPPSSTKEAGPYGYTTARNEDATDKITDKTTHKTSDKTTLKYLEAKYGDDITLLKAS
ncbi:hypothetical protein EVAR_88577_1 [Eumeta japonica]|uniref:Uncharacterized protein n=1 Tax=Eumeta variegata TaxID=151549 RepID=A0A4C1WMZ2_EUMVA|nr:hypothetical protein EVAR_88577_1 [Eumeta japonica]